MHAVCVPGKEICLNMMAETTGMTTKKIIGDGLEKERKEKERKERKERN